MHFNSTYLKILAVTLLIGSGLTGSAFAQINTADSLGFRFNNSYLGARSVALAEAPVSDAPQINGMYSNPATLLFSSGSMQLTGNSLYNPANNVMIQNLTTPLFSSDDMFLGMGVSLQHQGSSQLASTESPHPRFNQYDFSLAYAWKLHPTLSLGSRVDLAYGNANNTEKFASTAALGFTYTPSSSISYGIVYKGTGYRYKQLGSGLYYRTNDDGTTILSRHQLPHRLELGAALSFPSQINESQFVLTFSNEKVFGEPGLIYRGGLEVFMTQAISLRGGYFYSSPDANGARFGIGIDLVPLTISYSYASGNPELTGQFHQISISANLFNKP